MEWNGMEWFGYGFDGRRISMNRFLIIRNARLLARVLISIIMAGLILEGVAFANTSSDRTTRRGPNMMRGVNEFVMQVQIRNANYEVIKIIDHKITQTLIEYLKNGWKSKGVEHKISSRAISDKIFYSIDGGRPPFANEEPSEINQVDETKKGVLLIRIVVVLPDGEGKKQNVRILLNHDRLFFLRDQERLILDGIILIGKSGSLNTQDLRKCHYSGSDKLSEFVFCRTKFYLDGLISSTIVDEN